MANNDSKKDIENSSETLTMPVYKNGCFDNPWPTWKMPSLTKLLKFAFAKDNSNVPSDPKALDETLPVHLVTQDELNKFCEENNSDKIKVIWIGHASCLINMENCIILLDPLFSERCSPIQSFGPKKFLRFRPVPFQIEALPKLDAVVISHNHYDHLDYESVMRLNKKFGNQGEKSLNWFVGLKNGDWFRSCGVNENVHELNWWESKEHMNLKFVFTPAQHWCGRGTMDRNKTLWGSWSIIGSKKKLFFGGDTGYCSSFAEIGKKFEGFDLSFIPIGAYEPRWMMEPQHVDPEQAVQIHIDVKSKKSIGIHWGTFALANEFYLEPISKLLEALEKFGLDKNSFITIKHGESYEF